MMTRPRDVVRHVSLLAGAVFAVGLYARAWPADSPKPPKPVTLDYLLKVGKARDLKGRPARAADLRGRPVLLVFWEDWCAACAKEVPTLNALHDRYGQKKAKIAGVSVATKAKPAAAFARRHRVKYPLLVGGEKMTKAGQVVFLPTMLVFDREGRLSERLIGVQTETAIRQALERVMQPTSASP